MARSSPVTHSSPLAVYGQTHPGRQRTNNEDNLAWRHSRDRQGLLSSLTEKVARLETGYRTSVAAEIISSHGRLYIVADGVGGNADGEKASQAVVEEITRFYYGTRFDSSRSRQEQLEAAIQHATREVFNMAVRDGSNTASTLVAALVWDEGSRRMVQFANVGDSRGYLFRAKTTPNDQAVKTTDHVLSESRLTQSMGDRQVATAWSDVLPLGTDDVVVLCSDGLSDLLETPEIGRIVMRAAPQAATSELIAKANERQGHDNITAIVVRNGAAPVQWGALAKFGGGFGGIFAALFAFFFFTQNLSSSALPKRRVPLDVPTQASLILPNGSAGPTITLDFGQVATRAAIDSENTAIAATNAAIAVAQTQTAQAASNPGDLPAVKPPIQQPAAKSPTARPQPTKPGQSPVPPPPTAVPTQPGQPTAVPTQPGQPTAVPPPTDKPTDVPPPTDKPTDVPPPTDKPTDVPPPTNIPPAP